MEEEKAKRRVLNEDEEFDQVMEQEMEIDILCEKLEALKDDVDESIL